MSDRIPTFRAFDRVRIMQTDEMVERGLANKHGTVAANPLTPSQQIVVWLDDTPEDENVRVQVPASSLMTEE